MVDIIYCHPPLYPLPSREVAIKEVPLSLWERVRVRGKKTLTTFKIFED